MTAYQERTHPVSTLEAHIVIRRAMIQVRNTKLNTLHKYISRSRLTKHVELTRKPAVKLEDDTYPHSS